MSSVIVVKSAPTDVNLLFCSFNSLNPVGTSGTAPESKLQLTSSILTLPKDVIELVKLLLFAYKVVNEFGKDPIEPVKLLFAIRKVTIPPPITG